MARNVWWALVPLILSISPPSIASAQVTIVGPGSTVEGDVARGYGIYYDGLGQYSVNSAIGRSIDVDTVIKWNEYVYGCLKQRNRESAERLARERYQNKK